MAGRIRRRGGSSGIAAVLGGIALISVALAATGALAFFYFTTPKSPATDNVSLCPLDGPKGITVTLVDTSDDIFDTTRHEVLNVLHDQIKQLPEYYMLDIRVLDTVNARSRSLFLKCNPGDGIGLSEWTRNPRLARLNWIDSFNKPANEAVNSSLASAKAKNSPIMGALQDIALDQFSKAAVQRIPKTLIVISDMLEFTKDYSQYPSAGDLSYQRFMKSTAYLKYRTDLHGAVVNIEYVVRQLPRIDSGKHILFWREWIVDNRGAFGHARRLQGAN
jgi:hypothetical protein